MTNRLSVWSSFELFVTSYQVKLLQRDDINFRLLEYFLTLWTLSLKFFRNCLNVVTLIHRSLQQLWRFLYKCKDSSKRFSIVISIHKQWRIVYRCEAPLSFLLQVIKSSYFKEMTLIFDCWNISWLSERFLLSSSGTVWMLWHWFTDRCSNCGDFFTSARTLAKDSVSWSQFINNDESFIGVKLLWAFCYKLSSQVTSKRWH